MNSVLAELVTAELLVASRQWLLLSDRNFHKCATRLRRKTKGTGIRLLAESVCTLHLVIPFFVISHQVFAIHLVCHRYSTVILQVALDHF